MNLKKNDHYIGYVEDLTSQGMGVVKIDGFPIFVDGTIPEEEIELRIVSLKKTYGYGKLIKIIKAHENRVEVKDDLGRQTGTAPLGHIKYSMQLRLKKKIVKDSFERIGKFENLNISPTIGMVNPWQYRNKAQVPVRMVGARLETGYFRRGTNELIPMENYHTQHVQIDETINKVRDILRKYEVPAYDPDSHTGQIRHIVVRRGFYTGQIMVILVTRTEKVTKLDQIKEEIISQVPEVVSLVQNINEKNTNKILGNTTKILYGKDHYEDEILGLRFKISPQSFFQVNTQGAESLYYQALKMAKIKATDIVLDAYCGIGTIALNAAQKAKEVHGIEIIEEAIESARENATLNKIDNVYFKAGPAEKLIQNYQDKPFDIAIVDPPRKGLDPSFIEALVENGPRKIVYISCNPSTQARDCKILAESGYKLEQIQPVDMFPMTHHVECIALLQREIM